MKTQSHDIKNSTDDSFCAKRQTILGEIWKEHPIYSDYEVSNRGQIRSNKTSTPRVMKTHPNPHYLTVRLRHDNKNVTRYVHRLVLETFVGPGEVCLHIDNDPLNNHLDNLRWGTQVENLQQCRDENRHRWGGASPLTRAQADYILKSKLPYKILAKIFGVHLNTIKRIRRGITRIFKGEDTQRDL